MGLCFYILLSALLLDLALCFRYNLQRISQLAAARWCCPSVYVLAR